MYYLYRKIRWYVGVAVVLCLAITVMKYSTLVDHFFFGSSRQRASASQRSAPPAGRPPATSPQPGASPAPSPDVLRQLSQARTLLAEASTNASEALKHLLTWQTEVEPLRDQVLAEPPSSDGEGGDSSKLFDRLAYVLSRDRTSPQELRDATARIESFRAKVDDLMNQSRPAALSAIEMADISQLHATCKQAEENWQRDVEQALAIKHLMDSQTVSPVDPAAPTTVGSKVEDANARAALADLDQQIAREKEDEDARQKRAAELEKEQREQEEKEAELLANATSPEVKALLAPFLEPRTIQPSLAGTFSIRWNRTFEKKPMSLGKLIEIGALDESVLGLKKLALILGNRRLPEPKWSITSQPHGWSPEDEERLKRAQQMLRDYGPILVKAHWLSE